MQETFAYLLQKFPGFILTASLMTFLYPAVKNLSIAAHQKRRRASGDESNLDEILAPAADSNPADLSEVMRALSDAHREVVLMRFIDGLTLDEIAVALDIPPGTVKSRLHHALRQLRDDPKTRRYFL
jgi:RNA polymerase sigma-70 factor (ECF subfamily)